MTTMEGRGPLVRPGFRTVSVIAFVLLIPVLAWNVWDYLEVRRLNDTIETLARNGEPLREPYRTLKGQPAEADRTYRAAATLAEGLYSDLPVGFPSRLANAERDRTWPPDVLMQVRALTDRYREPIAMSLRAASLTFEGFAPGASGQAMGYLNSGLASLTRAMGLEAAVRASDGDADGALDALAAEIRLGTVSPFFSPIRFATDLRTVVERVRLPAAGLARLDRIVEGFDVDDTPKRDLRRDRAEVLRTWQSFRRSSPMLGVRVLPPWVTHETNRQVAAFAKLVSAVDSPWPQRIDRVVAGGEWPIRFGGVNSHDILEEFMLQHAQDLAVVRATRVVIAVERYRRAHGEEAPSRVDALAPDYLTAPPIDPFTGKPLMTASDARGYVVYSAGANRRDDGGADVDMGFASPTAWPRGIYTADTGIRIRYP